MSKQILSIELTKDDTLVWIELTLGAQAFKHGPYFFDDIGEILKDVRSLSGHALRRGMLMANHDTFDGS